MAPSDVIRNGDLKFLYVILTKTEQGTAFSCKLQAKLQFVITEIDIDTEEEVGSYDEDYDFPEVVIGVRDFVQGEPLGQG